MKKTEHQAKPPVDLLLLLGLALFCVYKLVDRFAGTIPDLYAYPWMLISVVLMLVGVYRTGFQLGKLKNKENKEENKKEN